MNTRPVSRQSIRRLLLESFTFWRSLVGFTKSQHQRFNVSWLDEITFDSHIQARSFWPLVKPLVIMASPSKVLPLEELKSRILFFKACEISFGCLWMPVWESCTSYDKKTWTFCRGKSSLGGWSPTVCTSHGTRTYLWWFFFVFEISQIFFQVPALAEGKTSWGCTRHHSLI